MSTVEAQGRRARLQWMRAARLGQRAQCDTSAAGEECSHLLISGVDDNMAVGVAVGVTTILWQ